MAHPTTEQPTSLALPTPLSEVGRPDSIAASFAASNTPSPVHDLEPPRASYIQVNPEDSISSTPRDSYHDVASNNAASNSGPLIPESEKPAAGYNYNEPEDLAASKNAPLRKKRLLWLALLGALVVLIIVIVVPVYVAVVKPNHKKTSGATGGAGGSSGSGPTKPGANPQSPSGAITGGDGSTVLLEDGTSFTYKNPYGGFCKLSSLCSLPVDVWVGNDNLSIQCMLKLFVGSS
jgi:glucan 1,3-beta-glucosidase